MALAPSQNDSVPTESSTAAPLPGQSFFRSDDWLAMVLGTLCLLIGVGAVWVSWPYADKTQWQELATEHQAVRKQLKELDSSAADYPEQKKAIAKKLKAVESKLAPTPLKRWLAKPGTWASNPRDAFYDAKSATSLLPGIAVTWLASALVLAVVLRCSGQASLTQFVASYTGVFVLAILAYVLSEQEVVSHYNLEYPLWALFVGLAISNTVGMPGWMRPAVRTELYIKIGLILLGAEVLMNKLLALGVPGVFVAWVVTPTVLIGTYLFGQYVLRIPSKSLNMVISADMSVCGVSAAIATAAACRAKKEELSLAIGISLAFTVIMMVAMPLTIKWFGMSDVLGGAWIGGTIDSTGAVAAAGEILGNTAMEVATTIKMIQNILIGVVAFFVAVYWVRYVDRSSADNAPGLSEVWIRFPKFVLGFLATSVIFSYLHTSGLAGQVLADAVVGGTTKALRGWLFCLAFVSIGLESNFRQLAKTLAGGKPLVLYIVGQSLNLALTLFMAWLMFEVVFPDAARSLSQ
jgi:uncharacterized integral membrane protein (TIGR00698 family)